MTAVRPDPAHGVFETVRVQDGHVQLLDEHLARLAVSVQTLYGHALPPLTRDDVLSAAATQTGTARMRIDAIAEHRRIEITITAHPVDPAAASPVRLAPVSVPGGLGAHKWRDRRFVNDRGADPVPLLVDGDEVLEAAWGNIWVLRGDRLITPPADGRILPGVTRARLLSLAAALGLDAAEASLSLADLRSAPVAFVTSAIRLAVPAGLDTVPATSDRVGRIRDALAS